MTRNHANRPAWEAIERLVSHHLDDERRDYEGCPEEDRGEHIYPAWSALARWAAADREEAARGYNGWSNYETWAIALWLDNEERSHRHWRAAARWCVRAAARHPHARDGLLTPLATARHLLADRLQAEVEEAAPIGMADLYSDLLLGALSAVDWAEVADGYLDGIAE